MSYMRYNPPMKYKSYGMGQVSLAGVYPEKYKQYVDTFSRVKPDPVLEFKKAYVNPKVSFLSPSNHVFYNVQHQKPLPFVQAPIVNFETDRFYPKGKYKYSMYDPIMARFGGPVTDAYQEKFYTTKTDLVKDVTRPFPMGVRVVKTAVDIMSKLSLPAPPKLHISTYRWLGSKGLSPLNAQSVVDYFNKYGIKDRSVFHEILEGKMAPYVQSDISGLTLYPQRYGIPAYGKEGIKGYGKYHWEQPKGREKWLYTDNKGRQTYIDPSYSHVMLNAGKNVKFEGYGKYEWVHPKLRQYYNLDRYLD